MHFSQVPFQAKSRRFALLRQFWAVIHSGFFLNGKQVAKLEATLSDYFPNGFVTTVGSGHDALVLALQACNLGPKDEILFPVNAYPTAFPVFMSGAKGVPVDVDENGQLSLASLKKKLTSRSRVLVVVHMFGLVGNMSQIRAFAKKYKLIMIEDCAQSFGTLYKNQPVGTWGEFGCFSFYPTKNLGTMGDGGAVWSKSKSAFKSIKQAKAYGEEKRYQSLFVSSHSRLPELQAAVLNIFLEKFIDDAWQKIQLAKYFRQRLEQSSAQKFVRVLESNLESLPVQHLLVIEVKKRNQLRQFLAMRGIETLIHYPYPVHRVPAFRKLVTSQAGFPMAERLAKNCLSLPFHQFLSYQEIDILVKKLETFYEH